MRCPYDHGKMEKHPFLNLDICSKCGEPNDQEKRDEFGITSLAFLFRGEEDNG